MPSTSQQEVISIPTPALKEDAGLHKTITLVQQFMIKKGLIDSSMTEEELQDFISEVPMEVCPNEQTAQKKKVTQEYTVKSVVNRVDKTRNQEGPIYIGKQKSR